MAKILFSIFVKLTKIAVFFSIMAAALLFAPNFGRTAQVPVGEKIVDMVRAEAPRYGVPVELALAILTQESRSRREAHRYEPRQISRGRQAAKALKIPADELEGQAIEYASSHCPLQVMGYHAPRFGLTWLDLYEPENCVRVSLSILAENYRAAGKRYKGARAIIRGAARGYNAGQIDDSAGEAYAQEVEARIVDRALSKIM